MKFLNPNGFTLRPTGKLVPGWPFWRKRVEYEFTLDALTPLTFQVEERLFVQPDRHGLTDMGSIPELAQALVPKDCALRSFVFHDSACREHGLYFSSAVDRPFRLRCMTSVEVHDLLYDLVCVERGPIRARVIWAAVRLFGPRFSVKP